MNEIKEPSVSTDESTVSNTVAVAASGERSRSTERKNITPIDLCITERAATIAMPMLDFCLAQVAKILEDKLEQSWKLRARIAGKRIAGASAGGEVATGLPTLTASFHLEGQPGVGRLSFDSSMVWLFLDVLLGGAAAPAHGVERQEFSQLERCLMQSAAEQVFAALSEAFSPIAPMKFQFQQWIVNDTTRMEGQKKQPCATLVLEFYFADCSSLLNIDIPLDMLSQYNELLSAAYPGENLGRDKAWREHFAMKLRIASVDVEAILNETLLPLHEIDALDSGRTISFGVPADGAVRLRAGGMTVCHGRLGRSGSRIAVRIEETAPAAAGALS